MTKETPIPNDIPKEETEILQRYWKGNLRLMGLLLLIWALAGLGGGILFADYLNAFNLPGTGYPLGFWFAQQGAIIIFVLLILAYALLMTRLDRIHHREREALLPPEEEKESFSGEGI